MLQRWETALLQDSTSFRRRKTGEPSAFQIYSNVILGIALSCNLSTPATERPVGELVMK